MGRENQLKIDIPISEALLGDDDQHCYLIRNCLTLPEQINVYQDILHRSKDVDNYSTNKPCMYPTPKTQIFNGNQSTLKFTNDNEGDNSNIYNQLIVHNANASLQSYIAEQNNNQHDDGIILSRILKGGSMLSMSVGVIRYEVPNGSFPEHIDHCNDNSWVYLLSLGCSANFVVSKKKKDVQNKKQVFTFNSGDVLVFDPSSKAGIVHGVMSINDDYPKDDEHDSCVIPEDFKCYRFGVQCRVMI